MIFLPMYFYMSRAPGPMQFLALLFPRFLVHIGYLYLGLFFPDVLVGVFPN